MVLVQRVVLREGGVVLVVQVRVVGRLVVVGVRVRLVGRRVRLRRRDDAARGRKGGLLLLGPECGNLLLRQRRRLVVLAVL